MPDRTKVIKGLEACIKYIDRECPIGCPYHEICTKYEGRVVFQPVLRDALSLLKENEAKTGTWQWKIHGKPESGGTLGEAVCDQCGKSTYATAVKGTLNYCPNCGANMMNRR